MAQTQGNLTAQQLAKLREAFAEGAATASSALRKWVNLPSLISLEAVEQMQLEQAMELLGESELPVCCCVTQLQGPLGGTLLLIFQDACGWALADLLLERPLGSSTQWTELECSAALESTNILGTNYFNGLAEYLGRMTGRQLEMIPLPPVFRRDYLPSILQLALADQAAAADSLLFVHTSFQVADRNLNWQLLYLPNPEAFECLRDLLTGTPE